MATTNCSGDHRYFVAETAADHQGGTVTIVALCTACGDVVSHTVAVTSGDSLKKGTKNVLQLP